MNIDEIIQRSGNLPASEIIHSVNNMLTEHDTIVVTAPPGAGKSTMLPLTISSYLQSAENPDFIDGKVLMLEPRRLAARQIAERMASVLGEPVGKTVGYRVRFEKKVSAHTRIEVLTEGILTRMLVGDPTLEGVSVVIFDEFHERSINSDLALALTRQAQQLIRPDLRIVIMSATLGVSPDTTPHSGSSANLPEICELLNAPLIESRGRMYDVETVYSGDATAMNCVEEACRAVRKAHAEHDGDILVFLPGQGEITRCAELLHDTLGSTIVLPLYGNLPPEQQRRAIAPSKAGERKVVLATPIAETSLTIEGVRIVVDSGLCRTLLFDARTGLSHLETVRISKDMATQRRGRAGRVAEGVCYRLWTVAAEHRMEEQRKPEILEADLAPMVLDIAAFGEKDVESLPWLTTPMKGSVASAKALLLLLGAIDDSGSITETGRRMAAMPCHPRISRMLLGGVTRLSQGGITRLSGNTGVPKALPHPSDNSEARRLALACDIAALLEEKDPLGETASVDISLRIDTLRRQRRQKALGRWARIEKIAHEYRRMMRMEEDNSSVTAEDVGALVACAYPERIAVAQDSIGTYRLSSGDNVRIDTSDAMTSYRWLAIAACNTSGAGRVFLAAPVVPEGLEDLITERDNVSWDSKELRVTMQRERRIGKLLIDSKPIHNAERQTVISIICEAVKKDGLSMLDWNEDVQRLQRRVAKVAEWQPLLSVPDISTEHLLLTAEEWLPFYLEQNGRIRTTAAEMRKIDLKAVLWALIPYDMQQEIDRLAPTHIQVPTGSRIRIDYRQGAAAPVLSVRLQECFGMEDTPRVNDGRQPLLMELLSPGFKPVQLTQDLRSFWQGTYFEVRKEMKRRYPKHYWPENPLEAEATRGVRRS